MEQNFMGFNIDTYFSGLVEDNVLISFKGNITAEKVNQLLEETEEKLISINEVGKVRKKVYNVLVESLQNLYHHLDQSPSAEDSSSKNIAVIVVKSNDNGYDIHTGNYIKSGKIKKLKDKIDKINTLNKEELKDLYKFILNHQKLSEKGGGGLGLVDIARKTENKLKYEFIPVEEDFFFFNLEVKIN